METKQCPAAFSGLQCELTVGHTSRHRSEGPEKTVSWSDDLVWEARKKTKICEARFQNEYGEFICERPQHKLFPGAKHWQGGVSWTQGGANRVARELAATKVSQSQ